MKHHREGTLEEWLFRSDEGDDMAQAAKLAGQVGISGIEDFLLKAEKLAEDMKQSGPLRAKRAQRLLQDVGHIRAALSASVDPSILYSAIGAGLTYANLANEKRFDVRKKRGKFTRSEYFAAKKQGGSREMLAERIDISIQGLGKWEKANLK